MGKSRTAYEPNWILTLSPGRQWWLAAAALLTSSPPEVSRGR
jgi:hypothetical protein